MSLHIVQYPHKLLKLVVLIGYCQSKLIISGSMICGMEGMPA